MKLKLISTAILTLFIITGCTENGNKDSITEGGMKCGPGKCGASMVDGSAILVKKKMNILNQLADNDNRRECVLQAMTTKELYDCVRVEKTGRLSTKCSTDNTNQAPEKDIPAMKCAPGKCGSDM